MLKRQIKSLLHIGKNASEIPELEEEAELQKLSISFELVKNFKAIDEQGLSEIQRSLENYYFTGCSPAYLASDLGKADMQNHLKNRLESFRKTIVPWLDEVKPLKDSKILEIGCGTGSSTISLAEQGAYVVGIDIERNVLNVAKDRCQIYGLDHVVFINANATEISKLFRGYPFDFIIFFAALEHMTHDERLVAMKETWEMLEPNSYWCIIETPNRLWYYDLHTSLLPFHMWLPDELAFKYTRFSTRINYREVYPEFTDERFLHFLRRGRGLSYHEFELAIDTVDKLHVVSSLSQYLRERFSHKEMEQYRNSIDYEYKSLLMRVGPQTIHEGFYEPFLDLILQKELRENAG